MSDYKDYTVLALRVLQLLCVGSIITGFIWASSDLLLVTALVEAPVTPISVLLMFYGVIGIGLSQIVIYILGKKKQ